MSNCPATLLNAEYLILTGLLNHNCTLDFQACEYFRVALDESCDIQGKPQLAILAQFISSDCLIKEELLDVVPLKDRTRGIDVKEAMMAAIKKANLPIAKLTAIITN